MEKSNDLVISNDEKINEIKSGNEDAEKHNETTKTGPDDAESTGTSEENQDLPSVPFKKLYKFADKLDYLLIFIGTAAAILHGAVRPLVFVIFGEVANTFALIATLSQCNYNYTECAMDNITQLSQNKWDLTVQPRIDSFLEFSAQLSALFAFFGLAIFVLGSIHTTCWSLQASRQIKRIRSEYFKSLLRQDITFHEATSSGELAARLLNGIDLIRLGMGEKVSITIQLACTTISGIILGLVSSWKLTLVTLAAAPVLLISAVLSFVITGSNAKKELEAYAKGNAIADEAISAIRTVTALGCQNKVVDRYSGEITKAKSVAVKSGFFTGFGYGLFDIALFGIMAIGLWFGSKLVIEGEITVTEFFGFFSVLTSTFSLGTAFGNLTCFTEAKAAGAKIFDVIERVPVIDSSDELGKDPSSATGDVVFDKVHFSYPSRSGAEILDGLNLHIDDGQTVALVGHSGCGKSTILQLIQRMYDCQEGNIRIGGLDLKDLNVRKHRELIGVVSQEPVLFATTIAENIRWGRKGVTVEEIHQAARQANAYDFIDKLPQKFGTLVGEGGGQMSGGQKQRIAIARAIVRNPKILLLDEATSALDTESESIVQAALEKASAGRTTILVAHRLSTILNADKIVVLQDGKVVEEGSHHDLLNNANGLYASLVSTQLEEPKQDEVDEEEDVFSDEPLYVKVKSPKRGKTFFRRKQSGALAQVSKRLFSVTENPANKWKSLRRKKSSIESVSGFTPTKRISPFAFTTVRKTPVTEEEEELNDEDFPDVSFLQILKYNRKEWVYIFFGCLAAAFGGSALPFFAFLFANLVGLFARTDFDDEMRLYYAAHFAELIFTIGCALFVFFIAEYTLFAKSGVELVIRMRTKVLRSILHQNISFFDDPTNNTGTLCARLGPDASRVQGATGPRIAIIVKATVTIVLCLALAFVYSWKLSLVALAFFPFQILGSYVESRILLKADEEEQEQEEKAGSFACEAITNIRTVASLTMERILHAQYDKALQQPTLKLFKKSLIGGLGYGFALCVVYFAFAAVFWLGAQLIITREQEFEDVFIVLVALMFGALITGQNIALAPNYSEAKVSARKIFAVLNQTPNINARSKEGLAPAHCKGEVTIKSAYFSYPSQPKVPVLRRLNISVKPGETLALVGHSGCGKSTVMQLLERFYDPKVGTITLDGVDIKKLNVSWLRQQMGLVSQEPVLFDQTIIENIRYGDCHRDVAESDVKEAAVNANIDQFVDSLPEKYLTKVGVKGSQLSGGQKQRVAIARALLRNPKILLLDEATSALDAESEKIVQATLDAAKKGRTTIVIAHRLSTIKDADKIAVVEQGVVVESGTHQQLLDRKGTYYKLWNTNVMV